jgi:predicted transcriptional regulator
MEKVCAALGPNAEIIAEPPAARLAAAGEAREQDILNMLSRRPCTAEDVSTGLGINPDEVNKCLRGLLDGGKVVELRKGKKVFYRTR